MSQAIGGGGCHWAITFLYLSHCTSLLDLAPALQSPAVRQVDNVTCTDTQESCCSPAISETCAPPLLDNFSDTAMSIVGLPTFDFRYGETTPVLISYAPQGRNFNELLNAVRAYMDHYSTIVVFPAIGIAGLVGNTLSVAILFKSGLGKSSNILLFALAVADSFTLFGAINVGQIARFLTKKVPYGIFMWEFPKDTCFVLSIVMVLTGTFNMLGALVSAAICTFITLERVIAVYFPMHFATIVTPTRAWMAVVFSFLLWTPYVVYYSTLYSFEHVYIAAWDTEVGYLVLIPPPLIFHIDYYVVTPVGRYVPLIVVAVGSILIAVRVNTAKKKRQEMVSTTVLKKPGTSRLTPTLLAVCVVFTFSQGLNVLSSLAGVDPTGVDNYNTFTVIGIVVATAMYVNSSSNFVIYIVFNKKFRDTLKAMCGHEK